jgi:hypothetical protein
MDTINKNHPYKQKGLVRAKIGRNALCPCGSGKKFKKCCLKKEEQQRAEQRSQVETQEAIEQTQNPEEKNLKPSLVKDQSKTEYDDSDVDEEFNDEEIDWDVYDDDEFQQKKHKPRLKLPKISEKENALIDSWYEKYVKMKDPDELKAHLDAFMDKYPHLVDHLELYQEALFEINGAFLRQNRHEEIVVLMERIRREYPQTYEQSHGYYDRDLIAYKIAMGKKNEIPPLLNYFKANPDKDPDNLFTVIDLLKLTNCLEILRDFIPHIYVPVCRSSKIFRGDEIMVTMVALCFAPFAKPDYTRQDLENLSKKLVGLDCEMDKDHYSLESLESMFELIFKKVTGWSLDGCRSKEEKFTRYSEITLNFQGYLHSFHGMDWTAADYYCNRIYKYLSENIPVKKRSDKVFAFSKDLIESTAVKFSQGLIGIKSIPFFGMLNAIFFFADYLYDTQSISPGYRDDIQKWCGELFEYAYPIQCKEDFEAIVFQRFPLKF